MNQTLRDIEIIMVDDVSPDHVPEMCDEWAKKDNRIRVIHKKKNGGLGFARNTGLEVATGEYVAFIDSDDYVETGMMAEMYSEAKTENLDALFTDFYIDGYLGYKTTRAVEELFETDTLDQYRLDIVGTAPDYPSCSKYQNSVWRGIYRLSVLKDHEILFHSEREIVSEDLRFQVDFAQYAKRIKIKPWKFYHYCMNEASLSHTYKAEKWRKSMNLLLDIDQLGNRYVKDTFVLHQRVIRTAIAYAKNYLVQVAQSDVADKKAAIKNIVKDNQLQGYLCEYPTNKLPLKWMIFALVLKTKSPIITSMFVKILK